MNDDFAVARWALGVGYCAATLVLLMVLTFAASRRARRHSVIDVAWGIGLTSIAVVSYAASIGVGDQVARLIMLLAAGIWGLRLAIYIGLRQRGASEDPRYTDMLDRAAARQPGTGRTALAIRKIYLTQAVALLVLSAPIQVVMYEGRGVGPLTWLGIGLWALGFVFETIGDAQLARFKADPTNRGKIMRQGLWSWTRHPNYFGDACLWWSLYLLATGHWPGWLTFFAPLAMTALLTRGTGAATLEKHLGRRPGFADYAASTSGFVPVPPRITRWFNGRLRRVRP